MSKYQVLARKYRPQSFREVLGQEAIVTTLKNAIRRARLAHAYLFCGARGTGKTTLARVFAKALNCLQPTADNEPCNQCSSCREITAGSSMDVLEIDGASHRGIDDIRQINENVGYATASGKYKIYIIDEVHMLTKEAFNALLKTLEEPPAKVMFLFATTEPHKVLPTILSRCQRFTLNRLPLADIMNKLRQIANDLSISIQEDAIRLVANCADGSLRDAESLFDQVLAFQEGEVSVQTVAAILGMMPRDLFFELDRAGKEANLAMAFEVAHQVFAQGNDVGHFIENLMEHYRNILLIKLAGKSAPFLALSENEVAKYEASARLYSQEQCLTILDLLVDAQQQKVAVEGRVALEALLLRILRVHHRIPVELLIKRLAEIEQGVSTKELPEAAVAPPLSKKLPTPSMTVMPPSSLTEDPTPSMADLGKVEKKEVVAIKSSESKVSVSNSLPMTNEERAAAAKLQSRYDTLLQFAKVELEGTLQ